MIPSVAIIGTAGRTGRDRLSMPLYTAAYHHAMAQVGTDPVALRSGGAPWMDHLAVKVLFGRYGAGLSTALDLFLPCEWDSTRCRFHDTGVRDWRVNPGGTLNYYHLLFGGMLRFDPFAELEYARNMPGVTFHVVPEFHNRNVEIVRGASRVLAYTWGTGAEPADGGTKHAWDSAGPGAERQHFPLHQFLPDTIER